MSDSSGTKRYEGREARRYPLHIPLEYRIYGTSGASEVTETGSGRTLNMSSAGVLFEADRTLRAGLDVDLTLAWPASLSKSVGLTLRVRGRIVRAEKNRVALTMTHYEFRTRSIQQTQAPEQNSAEGTGGDDGTRTRDLRRDRPAF